MDKLLCITGPTATGKTAFAWSIAKAHGGDIISADSRMVYRGMDIATGKDIPSEAVLGEGLDVRAAGSTYRVSPYVHDGVSLYLYDIVSPDNPCSIAAYVPLARAVIRAVWGAGRLPILTGGTGLYIASVLSPPQTMDIPPDMDFRKRFSDAGLEETRSYFRKHHPAEWSALNKSEQGNLRRLIRRLEVFRAGRADKREIADHAAQDVLCIGLAAPEDILKQRIRARVEARYRAGILDEVRRLMKRGYTFNLPSMSAIGYGEWRDVVEGRTMEDASTTARILDRWAVREWQYAKRQMTWLRKMEGIHWIDTAVSGWDREVTGKIRTWYTSSANG